MPGFPAQPEPIAKEALLGSLPPEWPDDLLPAIRAALEAGGQTFGVFDDDPTGPQTVHGALVVTEWSEAALAEALAERRHFFYILTNSRALPEEAAVARVAEAAHNLARAGRQVGRSVVAGVRGDSTLRGHHPAETWAVRDAMEAEQGISFDGELLVPFFLEGGRVTVGDVHYVLEGERFIPAGQTEFARDAVFGFQASNLAAWAEEKSGGRVRAGDVRSVSIDDLRRGGPDRVAEILSGVTDRRTVVVNAASYRDLEVFVLGLLRTEAAGKRFLYRTAASFVRLRGGLAGRPLLTAAELYPAGAASQAGGLLVVGSFVRRSTEQLEAALARLQELRPIELRVARILDDTERQAEIDAALAEVEGALTAGQSVALYTSRQLVTAGERSANLLLSQRVSAALVEIVGRLSVAPRFLIAKGGITASDLATAALGVRRAIVPGQVAPGVPCWLLGPDSRFPGVPYVIFPGNVGSSDSLAEVIELLGGG
jgi:uncharacterized protein YgbK (DUF1537 family)